MDRWHSANGRENPTIRKVARCSECLIVGVTFYAMSLANVRRTDKSVANKMNVFGIDLIPDRRGAERIITSPQITTWTIAGNLNDCHADFAFMIDQPSCDRETYPKHLYSTAMSGTTTLGNGTKISRNLTSFKVEVLACTCEQSSDWNWTFYVGNGRELVGSIEAICATILTIPMPNVDVLSCWKIMMRAVFLKIGTPRTCSLLWKLNENIEPAKIAGSRDDNLVQSPRATTVISSARASAMANFGFGTGAGRVSAERERDGTGDRTSQAISAFPATAGGFGSRVEIATAGTTSAEQILTPSQLFETEIFTILAAVFRGLCHLDSNRLILARGSPMISMLTHLACELHMLPSRTIFGINNFPMPGVTGTGIAEICRRRGNFVNGHCRWLCVEPGDCLAITGQDMTSAAKYLSEIRGIDGARCLCLRIENGDDVRSAARKMQRAVMENGLPVTAGLALGEITDDDFEFLKTTVLQFCSTIIIRGTSYRSRISKMLKSPTDQTVYDRFPPYGIVRTFRKILDRDTWPFAIHDGGSGIIIVPTAIYARFDVRDSKISTVTSNQYCHLPGSVLAINSDIELLTLPENLQLFMTKVTAVATLEGDIAHAASIGRFMTNSYTIYTMIP